MDLILLQPGEQALFGGFNSTTYGKDLIDGGPWTVDENNVVSKASATTGSRYGQCIELVSLQQGMKQQLVSDFNNAARTSGRPMVTEFTAVKYVDQTSVKLYEYCLRAQPIGVGRDKPSKIFIFRKSNEKFELLMQFQLRDAIISEIQLESHSGDMPTEKFMLSFTEILWTYSVQDANTGPAGHFSSGWSILRNQPIAQFTD